MISEHTAGRIKNMPCQFLKPVRLVLFTSDTGCATCRDMAELARAFKGRSNRIALETYDIVMDRDKTQQYGVSMTPAFVVEGGEGRMATFYGLIDGVLLDVLLNTIAAVADGKSWFPEKVKQALSYLAQDVTIRVFVESDCTQCRPVSETAIGLALESKLISTSIVVADEFPELIRKYAVKTLPKTLFGENLHMDGHVTESEFLEMVYQAEGLKPASGRRCIVCGNASPDIICMNCKTRIQAEAVEHKLKGAKLRQPD